MRASETFFIEPYMLHLAQQGFNEILLTPRQASRGNAPRFLEVSAGAGDLDVQLLGCSTRVDGSVLQTADQGSPEEAAL